MTTREITAATLAATIQDNDIVLLDFRADGCAPCRRFAPVFERASVANPDIVFGTVDTEAERELAAGFEIGSTPTLMAFREGVLVLSRAGALGAVDLGHVVMAVRGLDMAQVRARGRVERAERPVVAGR